MAFYKDFERKSRQEKREDAFRRGGFEEEGSSYRHGRNGGKGGYGDKHSYGDKPGYGDKHSYGDKSGYGDKHSYGDKPHYGDKHGYGDKPRFEGKPSRFDDKPRFGDKPPRFEGKPPRFDDKPRFGDKPPRFEGKPPRFDGKPPRFDDKPRFDGKPPRFDDKPRFGDKPPRFEGKPPRFEGKPPRFDGKPPRFEGKPPRFEGKPPRFDDKPPRFDDKPRFGDKPPRFGDKPPRFEGKPPRFDDQPPRFGNPPPRFEEFRYDTPRDLPAHYDAEEEAVPAENLLCGRNPIREALKSGRDIEKLMVAKGDLSGSAREILAMAKENRVPVQEVERTRLDAIAKNHQGMIAFASAYAYSTVEKMLAAAEEKGEKPFLVLLDGITDPHNLGAIIRSAECAGAHGVIVQERRAVGLTPAAVKASAGAIEYMPVARVTNLVSTIEDLKKRNIWVYAADMTGDDYESCDYVDSVAMVIGAEGEGVSRLVLDHCDKAVSLPIKGHVDSLNASVAAGILMYEVLKARQ